MPSSRASSLVVRAATLTFAVGVVAALVINASVTAGCAQTAPAGDPNKASNASKPGDPNTPSSDDEADRYLGATKAAVIMPPPRLGQKGSKADAGPEP